MNPGSRYVGFAVFHGQELVDWGMRSIRETSVKGKLARLKSFIVEMSETQRVNCIAVKGLHPARSSKYLRRLANEIKGWATGSGHIIREYTIKEIEAFVLPSGKLNKRRLMEGVAAFHPFLFPELEAERQNRNPYMVRMFEAVALGMKCLSDAEKLKGRKLVTSIHEKE